MRDTHIKTNESRHIHMVLHKKVLTIRSSLYADIRKLIDTTRSTVAQKVNSSLTILFWHIGQRIHEEILKNKRAEYGKKIIATLSQQLKEEYENGFSYSALHRMCSFHEKFPDFKIIANVSQTLSWSHIVEIIPLKKEIQREFYRHMCCLEQWSVRTLRIKIDSLLFERTAISKKPEKLAKNELNELNKHGKLSPDLVFKNPYILDFLNLKDAYQEKDLEKAILHEIEKFILELGKSFTFIERQKRMIVDNEDFYLELYLKWLEKNEMEKGEGSPIGLILCAEGKQEQIALLQLEKSNIRVAEYITKILSKELLHKKLHKFYLQNKALIENRC